MKVLVGGGMRNGVYYTVYISMTVLSSLVEKGMIEEADVSHIQDEALSSGRSIEEVLVNRGISMEDILQVKGAQYDIPSKVIGDDQISYEVLQYVPEESATHYKVAPLGVSEGVLEIGIVDPDNIEAMDALNFISARVNLPYKAYIISQSDFEKILGMYKGLSGTVGKALSELETELTHEIAKAGGKPASDEGEENEGGGEQKFETIKEDAPVTKIVATLLRNAVEGKASDIHIEHTGERVRVRFRLDGVLYTSIMLPPKVHRAVVARIKILASMKLDEKRKPQDGRFSATIGGRKVDFRVSTFPATYGEKVVMRILDRDKGNISLEALGFDEKQMEYIKDAITRPYGLILITGPTGSGKSTTLQAMLWNVDRETKNVLSLEDPVEYNIDGVSQSQVRPEIGYTFASGLRSTLRQDPDIIMVGEIRDKETAQLAIQASLTGHLVFSTIHTNTAVGVIPRLMDMGVDPYLIAPTLQLVIGQRLVRKLCPDSGTPIPVEGSIKMMIEKQFEDLPERYKKNLPWSDTVYAIEPTGDCPSGTRGRVGAFEMMPMNKELEQAILDGGDEQKIWAIMRKNGMLSMKEDAIIKAFKKIIPFEEINTLGGAFSTEEESVENGGQAPHDATAPASAEKVNIDDGMPHAIDTEE